MQKKYSGIAASNGKYEGVVKILKTTEDFPKVNDGDIIVVYASSPAWTPPLMKAGALVAEVGGILCHTAIIAREMGVPSVVDVENITNLLKDGDIISVDGGTGEIYVLD